MPYQTLFFLEGMDTIIDSCQMQLTDYLDTIMLECDLSNILTVLSITNGLSAVSVIDFCLSENSVLDLFFIC